MRASIDVEIDALPGLEEIIPRITIGSLMRRLRRIVVTLYEIEASDLGVGPVETVLLRILLHQPCDTESLCSLAALDIVSFSKSIKKLQHARLLEATRDQSDKRRRIYVLTRAGIVRSREVTQAAKNTEELFLSRLSPQGRRVFMRLFTRLTLAHAISGAVQQDPRISTFLGGQLDPGTLLRRARQISVQFYEAECHALGLSAIETGAVRLIGDVGPFPVKALPKLLDVNRGSAFAVTAKLLKAGHLDTNSHAARTLKLSRSGMGFYIELVRKVQRVEDRFLKPLTRDERSRLTRLMQKLYLSHITTDIAAARS